MSRRLINDLSGTENDSDAILASMRRSVLILRCPLCDGSVDTSELQRLPGTAGGLECPRCGKVFRFHQPYLVLRTVISISISVGILWIAGVRNIPIFLVGTFILWIPISLVLNAYLILVIPLVLVPYKPRNRIRSKTFVELANERNATIELFEKKQK